MPSPPPLFSSYATFSKFIASDNELSMYRNFRTLSSRNQLYLQSSLTELENQLKEFDEEDSKQPDDNDVLLSAKSWETFPARAKEHPREAERMEIILDIKVKMKEYRKSLSNVKNGINCLMRNLGPDEALLLQSQILDLSKPDKRAFRVFQDWFERRRPYIGYGCNLLANADEFVALKPSKDQDAMTRLIQNVGGTYLPVCSAISNIHSPLFCGFL